MATYLPKTFSLKTTGERLASTMENHFNAMAKIFEDQQKLKSYYVGDMLKLEEDKSAEKIKAQRTSTTTRIDEIEQIALENIKAPMLLMKPTDIVQSDLMLLDDKIFPVDQNVFDRLVDTYKSNFPMMQALCKYAIDHEGKSLDVSFSNSPKAGYINFDLPPTVDAMTDLVTATAAFCKSSVMNSTTNSLGFDLSVNNGNIKKMIDMG